jgi:DNA polymerase (family 10)
MDNKEIASVFKLVGQLMEIHGENKFKARSYGNAAFQIGKYTTPIRELSPEAYGDIPGIGKNLIPKLEQLVETGSMDYLQGWLEQTPEGVVEMLKVKGLGPGKIRTIWQEMEIESIGELLYACNENRLVDLKGFGEKTQKQVKEAIEFLLEHKNRFLYASIEPLMNEIKEWVTDRFPDARIQETGDMLRRSPVVDRLEFVVTDNVDAFPDTSTNKVEVIYHSAAAEHFDEEVLQRSVNEDDPDSWKHVTPEMRGESWAKAWYMEHDDAELIEWEDLKGCLHNHSTYSDGMDLLEDMADHLQGEGFEYLGISDHSKTAVYAGGLKEDDILRQHAEIDELNAAMSPFKVLKGIESDILTNGDLDYTDDVLDSFDFIVASVHSVLKMDESTATARLIKAIEHPATSILGHPTGRLLLSRPGYPLDHKKIIDACAANKVAIELNANPMRLDIDYKWIPYCMEKEVMIAINPDAHRIRGFDHMRYGVLAARKGGLIKSMCLNALTLNALETYLRR